MGKCRKCGKELTGIETTGWFGKLCEKCWQEQHYTQYPFKKGIDEKDKKIADLEAKLAESEERLKAIDNWKENYGYLNYEDVYMLEDLQSRAFQSEDDTKVVNELLDYLNISDESEILSTFKQQLAEKEKECAKHKEETVTFTPKLVNNAELVIKIIQSDADGIDYLKQSQNQTAIAELEKVKEVVLKEVERVEEIYTDGFQSGFNCCYVFMKEQIDQQIRKLKN